MHGGPTLYGTYCNTDSGGGFVGVEGLCLPFVVSWRGEVGRTFCTHRIPRQYTPCFPMVSPSGPDLYTAPR